MLSILIGIALVIVAVVEWLGHVTDIHGIAILTGVVGIAIALYGAVPAKWTRL